MPVIRRFWQLLGALSALALIAWATLILPRRPSASRDWSKDHQRLARASFNGDSVHITDVRNFRYTTAAEYTPGWYDRSWDLRRLNSVWFIVTPFSTSFRGPAHTFLSFGFDDSSYVSISVEARREADETYGFVSGLLRQFEVAYIVGDERDLIARRALFDGGVAYLYPIETSQASMRRLFVDMLTRANALQQRPEFYNTLTSNCTSNLIHHVNAIVPGRVKSGIRTILPGYADAVAHDLGLIAAAGSLASVRDRFQINERAKDGTVDGTFSTRIRRP